mmetsp:Transcript_7225/g.18813  ORF Transcript_7225/g.18813 Transcript_7225/m.18813 type:complete len:220 (-) Transcript_7225:2-661(-)
MKWICRSNVSPSIGSAEPSSSFSARMPYGHADITKRSSCGRALTTAGCSAAWPSQTRSITASTRSRTGETHSAAAAACAPASAAKVASGASPDGDTFPPRARAPASWAYHRRIEQSSIVGMNLSRSCTTDDLKMASIRSRSASPGSQRASVTMAVRQNLSGSDSVSAACAAAESTKVQAASYTAASDGVEPPSDEPPPRARPVPATSSSKACARISCDF